MKQKHWNPYMSRRDWPADRLLSFRHTLKMILTTRGVPARMTRDAVADLDWIDKAIAIRRDCWAHEIEQEDKT